MALSHNKSQGKKAIGIHKAEREAVDGGGTYFPSRTLPRVPSPALSQQLLFKFSHKTRK